MWRLRWNLAILCFLALQSAAQKNDLSSYEYDTEEARLAMEIVIEGIEEAKDALVSYDKLVEQVIPWKDFNETLVELDRFREDYSIESALLISEIKTFMMDGIDAYFLASQDVYMYAGTTASHLELYIKLFNGHDARHADAQKNLLLEIFDTGIKKLKTAQDQLGKSSESFNSVFGKLSDLRKRFEDEFDEKSEFFKMKMKFYKKVSRFFGSSIFGISGYFLGAEIANRKYIHSLKRELEMVKRFYYHLHLKIELAIINIVDTKKILQTEIQHISNLKVQIEEAQMFVNLDYVPDLRDTVINAAQNLITMCAEYRKRHIEKTEINNAPLKDENIFDEKIYLAN